MKIFAYSKGKFNRFMREQRITDSNIESCDIYAFISILDVAGLDCEGYFDRDHDNLLTLHFGDYTEPPEGEKPGPGWFNDSQANKIIDFVEKHKDKSIMIVHCTAGISRSGAVATFINDLYGNKHKEFMGDNKQIQPNYFVLRKLREQYRKRYPTNYNVTFDDAIENESKDY